MLSSITNHLWQSTAFAALAALLALALRGNRAQVRYWLWLAASVKFLVPFSLLVEAGNRIAPPVSAVRISRPVERAMNQTRQTFAPVDPLPTGLMPEPRQNGWIPAA